MNLEGPFAPPPATAVAAESVDTEESAKQAGAAPRLTKRGAATRARIVDGAAELIRIHGVGRTTLDDVIAVSSVSKSQLYRHFEDKSALVRAVIDLIGEETMEVERERLGNVNSFEGLEYWRDAIVSANTARQGRHGCPLGTLVLDVSDEDELACQRLDDVFRVWKGLFETLLHRFRDQGLIPQGTNIAQIATGFIVAIQGGHLLARTVGNFEPMALAIDVFIEHLRLLSRVEASVTGCVPGS